MEHLQLEPEQHYRIVYRILVDTYGKPVWRPYRPPVDALIATILSQATSDVNSSRAFQTLKRKFPDWESVMDAPPEQVIQAIHSAGLANQKGPRIQAALRHIYQERGELSLDFLADLPLQEAIKWLTNIVGVGRKTAAILLLFTFGRPTFPVDTHVHRVAGRLGLIGPRISAEKAHDILEAIGDPATFYPMHISLIRHGREICQARFPHCALCPLQDYCVYYAQISHHPLQSDLPGIAN
jgi:endonuclease-3